MPHPLLLAGLAACRSTDGGPSGPSAGELDGAAVRASDPPATAAPLEAIAPPTANLATYREMWLDAATPRAAADGRGRIVADAVPDEVVAGAPVELDVSLEVDAAGIAEGGSVTLTPSPFWGWTPPQAERPGAPGYTRVQAPEGVALDVSAVGGMLFATVRGRALARGERVRFVYGEGGTARADRFAERAAALWVSVDGDGDGVRAVVGSVEVTVRPGPPAALIATLPSAAEPGSTVTLRLAAIDAAGNGFVDWKAAGLGEVTLRATPGLSLPDRVSLDAEGLASIPVRIEAPGVHAVEAAVGPLGGASAPMVARVGAEPILWGDLQVHTALSDGTGAPADVLRYARDVAGLDVVALTDHDHWGMRFLDSDPDAVRRLAEATDAADQPGRFVAVHGFEWTSWVWGHRHVLWFDRARPWLSSLDPRTDTPDELCAALRGQPALVIRHHPAGGPVAVDWSTPLDPELEPVVEIASVHGQSESRSLPGAIYDPVPAAFADVVLAGGARFGLIGSTDGHDGHPGLSHLVGGQGGLVALVGAEPNRASVLRALRERRVYATNGPRILLRLSVGDTPMGAPLRASAAGAPSTATIRVVGTAPIDRIELVRRDGVAASRSGDGSALLYAEIPLAPTPGDLLYARVIQQDGGIAWSSPIFFE